MKNLLIFLALLLVVTPSVFAGQVAGKDTVNGWYFWKAEGENQDTTWTNLTDSAISGKSSQVFGVRSKGGSTYFWVKKLEVSHKTPREIVFPVFMKKYTGTNLVNYLRLDLFVGNTKTSELVRAAGGGMDGISVGSSGYLIPVLNLFEQGIDSVNYLVLKLNFIVKTELVTSEIVTDDVSFVYDGLIADSVIVVDDGGEPKFPQFKTAKPKINFGAVAKNSRKLDSVLVTNTGDAPLVLSKLWTDDFSFSAHCSTVTIAPQASTNVVVEFAQDSLPGLKRAKLYVEHNASGKLDSIELVADFATSVGDDNLSPQEFNLYQNYPNPFNPSTSIKYSLSGAEYVRLAVYNLLGQEVALLVDGEREAGEHTIQFSAQNLSSGTYIYRLRAGNFIATKKMVFMK